MQRLELGLRQQEHVVWLPIVVVQAQHDIHPTQHQTTPRDAQRRPHLRLEVKDALHLLAVGEELRAAGQGSAGHDLPAVGGVAAEPQRKDVPGDDHQVEGVHVLEHRVVLGPPPQQRDEGQLHQQTARVVQPAPGRDRVHGDGDAEAAGHEPAAQVDNGAATGPPPHQRLAVPYAETGHAIAGWTSRQGVSGLV